MLFIYIMCGTCCIFIRLEGICIVFCSFLFFIFNYYLPEISIESHADDKLYGKNQNAAETFKIVFLVGWYLLIEFIFIFNHQL